MKPIDAITKDYESTLGFIDKCDDHMFKIKNWGLFTTSAVIAFTISRDEHFIVLVNFVLIPSFLYLELIYKSLQDDAIEHTTDLAERIDAYLQSPSEPALLKEYSFGFGRKLKYPSIWRTTTILRNRQRRHIVNFYALIAAFSLGAFLLARWIA